MHKLAGLVVVVVVVACAGSPPARDPVGHRAGELTPGAAGDAGPPDRDALVELLRDFAAVPFSARAVERGCPAEATIDAYVTRLVQYGTAAQEPGDVFSLRGGCGEWPAATARIPLDPPYDAAYWFCILDARTVDAAGESPWNYDLRFRMHRTERTVDLATAGCAGTP